MTNYNQVGQALCKDGSVPKIANCNSFGYNKVVKIENTQVNHVKRLCTGYNHDNVSELIHHFLKTFTKRGIFILFIERLLTQMNSLCPPGIL